MKALITGSIKYSKEQLEILKSMGLDIIFLKDEREKISFSVSDIECVICNGLFLYNDIRKFKNLRYIQVTSAGLDRLPMEYINKNNIKVYNARGVYSIPIAEWTILKILEIYKKSKFFYKNQEQCKWEKNRYLTELNGKKACIIGYGSIGIEIAKRLKAFNVKVTAIDTKKVNSPYIDCYYNIEKIEEVMSDIDINILSLPLTEQTKYIINKDKLNKMKQDAILINIARGKLIDEQALIEILKQEKFSGVVLDVFEEEPLKKENELWKYNNVIITPHNSFVSDKNNERMFETIKKNISEICNL